MKLKTVWHFWLVLSGFVILGSLVLLKIAPPGAKLFVEICLGWDVGMFLVGCAVYVVARKVERSPWL